MKTIDQWLSEYGESHQNPTNKLVHWFCVPAIFWTVFALLWWIKLPATFAGVQLNIAIMVGFLVLVYYATLSPILSLGMFFYVAFSLFLCHVIESATSFPLWAIGLIVFIAAWILQFWGHNIEGKKPSFAKDLQFLLIGPAWVMSFLFKKIGVNV